ncbi:glycerophosphodiester phosphodiesterase [Microbulbifer sp. OS29]|uniref:Glycerophosphodiester phosphodiesterase n=1 Tax=Microbulbifer okhotskensis TaxID=2926617 RepID=A0A9X2J7L9_9GAMM|nr:glycerophosphodiester phosphodiesterase [Microbulbifer okhotskensis]MCO1335925.1 glycerophosphodiester phosphodiesterase [Microbulbifer okhotskensis]
MKIIQKVFICSAIFVGCYTPALAIDILAHRGASGEYPQGTALAFDVALQQGADILELDVHLSEDQHIIINHDADLKDNVGVSDKIKELTLSEIKAMDAGHEFTLDNGDSYPFRNQGLTLITLNELFERHPNTIFNVEIKPNDKALSEILWQLIVDYRMEQQVTVASQHSKAMNHFRDISQGEVKTSATIGELIEASLAWSSGFGWAFKPKFDVAQLPYSITTKPYVRFFQKKGVKVDLWTVNTVNDIERSISLGVDGIIGDYPERIYEALENAGER